MKTTKDLPTCFILVSQIEMPTREQLTRLQSRYKEMGYQITTPNNIVRFENTKGTYYAIEVRKES